MHQTKRRGLAIVISDFYDPAGYEEGLNLLRYHRFEPTVLQVWSAAEARPTLRGDLELVDVETRRDARGHRHRAAAGRLRRARTPTTARKLESFCAGRALPYYRADVAVPFEELVLRMFREGGFLS